MRRVGTRGWVGDAIAVGGEVNVGIRIGMRVGIGVSTTRDRCCHYHLGLFFMCDACLYRHYVRCLLSIPSSIDGGLVEQMRMTSARATTARPIPRPYPVSQRTVPSRAGRAARRRRRPRGFRHRGQRHLPHLPHLPLLPPRRVDPAIMPDPLPPPAEVSRPPA